MINFYLLFAKAITEPLHVVVMLIAVRRVSPQWQTGSLSSVYITTDQQSTQRVWAMGQ